MEWQCDEGGPIRRSRATSQRLPDAPLWQHRSVLRDLAPSTRYRYRVPVDRRAGHAEREPPWRSFATAPASWSEPYHALFLCDVGLAGREDGTTGATTRVLREMAAEAPLFTIGGGDYAYARGDRRFRDPGDAIEGFLEQMEPLFSRAPFMPQYGNHETGLGESAEAWSRRFALPAGSEDGRCYSFDVGCAHFAGLFAPGVAPAPQHLRWLEADLASERAQRAAWRIVFQHAPVFASGSSHPARPELRALMPLLEKLRVDLHLSGHDQSYERTHPLRGGEAAPLADPGRYRAGGGVLYAKVSPAGKLSERGGDFSRFRHPAGPEIAARDDGAHHWARLEVSPGALSVEVRGLVDPEGAVRSVDRFTLERAESDTLAPVLRQGPSPEPRAGRWEPHGN